jgi:hypothetical protein
MSIRDLNSYLLSLVVWYEITATPIYQKKRTAWEQILNQKQQKNLLAAPTFADWHKSSRLIWEIQKSKRLSIPKDATAWQNDMLICHSAFEWYKSDYQNHPPILIVTDNIKDFAKCLDALHRHYAQEIKKNGLVKIELVSGDDYF